MYNNKRKDTLWEEQEEKLKMIMAVIQEGKAVSDVAQENKAHPNMILNWMLRDNMEVINIE